MRRRGAGVRVTRATKPATRSRRRVPRRTSTRRGGKGLPRDSRAPHFEKKTRGASPVCLDGPGVDGDAGAVYTTPLRRQSVVSVAHGALATLIALGTLDTTPVDSFRTGSPMRAAPKRTEWSASSAPNSVE